MANTGWTADPADLTVPPDAGPNDSRIHISPGNLDPILTAFNQTGGIVFYIRQNTAFILSAEGPGAPGELHLWAVQIAPDAPQLHQIIDWFYFPDATPAKVEMHIMVDSADPAEFHWLNMGADLISLGDFPQPVATNPNTALGADVQMYGQSMERGLQTHVSVGASSANIGTTETVVLTLPSISYRAGRWYEAKINGGMFGSAATNFADLRLRKTNTAGTLLGSTFKVGSTGVGQVVALENSVFFKVDINNDVTANLVLTLQASAGTVGQFGSADTPRSVKIWDRGYTGFGGFAAYPTLT